MKNIKKAIYVFGAVMLSGFLFACPPSGSEGLEGATIHVLAYGESSNEEGQAWVRLVNAFEAKYPEIQIEYEMFYDEAYHQKVTARLAAGDVPDLAYMGADARWGAPWAEVNQQYDHSSIMDSGTYDLSLIPDMDSSNLGKQIYEIPLGTSNLCTVLFANEALITELGFDLPETYADMVAMVSAANAAGLDVLTIDGADEWAWGSCLMSMAVARITGDAHWVSKAVAGEKSFTDPEFVAALGFIETMLADGVLTEKMALVDYGTNLSNFMNEKALFMVQGQWAAGGITVPEVADNTVLMAWPTLPGEKAGVEGSVAGAIQVGYGLTAQGASDPAVADAAMMFLDYFYSEAESTQRLRDGAIVAPILAGYQAPADLPDIIQAKIALAQESSVITEVIDSFLSGQPNDTLNVGMQNICAGMSTPAGVAQAVEDLLR